MNKLIIITSFLLGHLSTFSQNQNFDVDGRSQINANLEALRLNGSTNWLSFYNGNTYKGYLYHNNTQMYLSNVIPNGNLYLGTNDDVKMTILASGSVGIGTINPDPNFQMDIANRIRLRSGGGFNTAGIGFNNPDNSAVIAFVGVKDASAIGFYGNNSGWGLHMNTNTGNVGIGTDNPTYKLSVLGNIRCTEAVVETGWADFVFDEEYRLASLDEVEKFIQANNHLPNIPPASEIQKNGLRLGEIQTKMMAKIEELTLYIIQQQKELDAIKKELLKED